MFENNLREYLGSLGASLIGFADLSNIDVLLCDSINYGIAIAVKISPEVILGISKGPTKEYYNEYNRLNKLLDNIVTEGAKYINKRGYNAIGQTTTFVTSTDNLTTPLPHKTVATRAGVGWIGKNALLTTDKYGSAIRLSSILTDMPLEVDTTINKSKCGNCTRCTEECPASAIKGELWHVNVKREELLDPFKCQKKARELMKKRMGIETTICGKCIEVCPFTKRYISKSMDSLN